MAISQINSIHLPRFAKHLDSPTSDSVRNEYARLKKDNKEPGLFQRMTMSDYIASGLIGFGVIGGLMGAVKQAKTLILTSIASIFSGVGFLVYGFMNGISLSNIFEKIENPSIKEELAPVAKSDVTSAVLAEQLPADVAEVAKNEAAEQKPIAAAEQKPIAAAEPQIFNVKTKIDTPTATDTMYAKGPTTLNVQDEFIEKLAKIDKVRLLSEDISSIDFIKENLPIPKYKIQLNGCTYFLSEPFSDSIWDRPSFNLYLVKKDSSGKEKIYARGVYKSNSQSLWRVASHTTQYLDWIGKGFGEDTTNIPLEIQPKLERILENYDWNLNNNDELAKVLARLADDPPKTFHVLKNVELGSFTNPGDPSSYKYTDEQNAPDFNRIVDVFKSKNKIYGEMKSYVVESKDRKFKYLFNVASNGNSPMVWIGGVEYSYNEINNYGVNLTAVQISHGLLMPAYEYSRQVPAKFKGRVNPLDYGYYDATAFTHKLPPVKEFIEKVLEV